MHNLGVGGLGKRGKLGFKLIETQGKGKEGCLFSLPPHPFDNGKQCQLIFLLIFFDPNGLINILILGSREMLPFDFLAPQKKLVSIPLVRLVALGNEGARM